MTTYLYPINYVEPTPSDPPEDTAEFGRDKVWCRNALDIAVPEGGDPLTIEQLLELFLGTPWPSGLTELAVTSDPATAIAEVQKSRSNRSYTLRGPNRVRCLSPVEIIEIIEEAISERQSTWTFNSDE